MNQINKYAEIHFAFLYKFGYRLVKEKDDNAISFVGEKNQIEIIFSTVSYEITSQFIDNDNNVFSLQDGLEYISIREFKGFYQIPSKSEMEKGIIYVAEAVKVLFQKIDISNPYNFQKIYQFSINTHKDLLKKYYVDIELKKAEGHWERKEYVEAKELFEKNIDYLSEVQLKKLEYIVKKMERYI